MNRKKILLISFSFLIVLVLISLTLSNNKTGPSPGGELSGDALSVVEQYVQAQQDSIGADQKSPDSWFDEVQPITTAIWFSKIHPQSTSTTGTVSYNYSFAHQKNYIVKAELSNCVWDGVSAPTGTSGLVDCSLNDTTLNKTSGKPIAAADLPFSWTAVGKQASPRLSLVKQNDKWLVDGDLTNQAQ